MNIRKNYNHTLNACYLGYITQAIVNNFAPLLFLTFQSTYEISLDKIALLVSFNFGVQLIVDLLAAKYVDKIGYRNSVVAAHIFGAVGLVGLAVFPSVFPDAYAGLLLAVFCYAIGGGLIEVLISPIVESCPTERKAAAMSLLHSFYCWGHVGVILISTAFFAIAGIENWRILAVIWAILPALNAVYFGMVPIQAEEEDVEGIPENFLGVSIADDLCRSIRTGNVPVGISICRIRAACRKGSRGSGGTMSFCTVDGKFKTALCEDE